MKTKFAAQTAGSPALRLTAIVFGIVAVAAALLPLWQAAAIVAA
jgi:hypothetical protein